MLTLQENGVTFLKRRNMRDGYLGKNEVTFLTSGNMRDRYLDDFRSHQHSKLERLSDELSDFTELNVCAIDMPNVAQDIFRPPVDCSMCENVKQMDKINLINLQEFKQSGHRE
ncbi:hypothetical protein CHUAL_013070 [Chamberlinius hualienensis]